LKQPNRSDALPLFIATTQDGVEEVRLGRGSRTMVSRQHAKNSHPLAHRWRVKAQKELRSYLSGRSRSFSTPCDLRGLPAFTHAVLEAATQIPYGEVRSYRWLAQHLGKPRAARAVGNALARNPIPIIIPCHRVVRSNGTLGGYALGTALKKRLLEMEKKHSRLRGKARGWQRKLIFTKRVDLPLLRRPG